MSWKIDPSTGDYVMDSSGKPIDRDSLLEPAYYRLVIGRKRWMYAPDDQYGSALATIKKKNITAIVNAAQDALKPLVDDGRAIVADVQNLTDDSIARNNSGLQVNITSADGVSETIPLPPVGD